jgi:hypothetical protein
LVDFSLRLSIEEDSKMVGFIMEAMRRDGCI